MAHNPQQAVIEFLSAPIATSSSRLVLTGDNTTQRGTRRTSGGLGAIASTVQFLKERETTHFYACIVAFTDTRGHAWEMVCLVQQDDTGNWILRNGSGGAPRGSTAASEASAPLQVPVSVPSDAPCGSTPVSEAPTTRIELLGGPGVEGGYYAGGRIVGPDAQHVKRVQLIAANNITLEDTIDAGDDGRVLFVSEHVLQEPIRTQFHPTWGP